MPNPGTPGTRTCTSRQLVDSETLWQHQCVRVHRADGLDMKSPGVTISSIEIISTAGLSLLAEEIFASAVCEAMHHPGPSIVS